jgi:hypothetical protein
MKKLFGLTLVLGLLTLLACKKEPGYGGLATITGKVYAYDSTTGGNLKDKGYVGDFDVFIGVEGESGFMDNIKTSFDGSYKFDGLRKGKYNVWVYRRCDACVNDIKVILRTIEIKSNKDEVALEDFIVVI